MEVVGKWRVRVGEGVGRDQTAGQRQSRGGTGGPCPLVRRDCPEAHFSKGLSGSCLRPVQGPQKGPGTNALAYHKPVKMNDGREEGCGGCYRGAGQPTARDMRQEGFGVCEDFLEEEDPHKPQHGSRAVQEIHEREMFDLY